MGLFSIFQTDEQRKATEVRTGARAPTRSERAKCWEARDRYFACLDGANIVDAVGNDKAARRACGAENGQFEQDCAAEWVRYFKQWRVADHQKRKRLAELQGQGAIQMDVTSQFSDGSAPKQPTTSLGDLQDRLESAKRK